jgi:hypothetical protein
MINKGDAMEAENIELKFYHGTNRKRGQKFIKNQSMKFSKGEKHWLGDGIYLFEDDFWAYWWIRELYKEKYLDQVYPDIYQLYLEKHYQILFVTGNVLKNRVFNLNNSRHKLEFIKVMKLIKEKEKYSEKMQKQAKVEGIVLNYMFNELDYKKDFDLVKADFIRDSDRYSRSDYKIRLDYNSQEQYCIKNSEIVNSIEEFDFLNKILSYYEILDLLFIDKNPAVYYNYNQKDLYEI